jgi:hypothetical protein
MKPNLKKLSAFMLAFSLTVLSTQVQAQVPQKFNYQGIARDAKGNPIGKQNMSVKLTVLPASDATEGEYEEIQTVTTNEFGLYTLQIGNGTPLKGEMSAVKWETGNKYIKVAIDPKGGSDFVDAGTNQLLSVPYAIYADKAGVAKNSGNTSRATNNFIEKTDGSGNVNATSQIFDNGTNIGIGTTSPVARVHVNANSASVQEHIRMQNLSPTGAGRFTLYNNNANAFATFTKYGTNYAGGYTGISSLYPYANLLAFGNNDTNGAGNGRFLISTEGNTGISIFKGGTSKLKYHVDYATENVGIGGNATPASRVHMSNTDGTSMDLKLTNNTTGHLATDGFEIRNVGNAANIMNKEAGMLSFGTNDIERARFTSSGELGIGTTTPALDIHLDKQSSSDVSLLITNSTTGNTALDGTRLRQLGNEFLITNNDGALRLGTNANTRLMISGTGEVGINTLTPSTSTKLHVEGDVHQSGTDYMFLSGTTNPDKMLISHSPTFTNYGIQYQDATDKINFLSAGTPVLGVDLGTLQVGVGTNTPTAKLDVVGSFKVQNGSQGAGKVMTSDANGLATWTTPSAAGLVSGSGTTNYVPKFTPNGSTMGNSQIFDNGTSVGMGTATPNAAARLHLAKSNEVLRLDGSSPWLSFYNGADYNGYLWHNNTDMYLSNRKSGGGLRFYTENISRMMIDSNGYVGIGTTAPTSRLDLRSNNGDYLLANFRNTSTTGDRSALLGLQSGNSTGATQWLMGVGGTSNGLGFTGNQFYLENTNKGARMSIDSFGAFKFSAAGSTQNGSTLNIGGKDNQPEASVSFNTNGEFFNMSVNTSGQLQFTPNNHVPTTGTPAMIIDDESGGRVAIGSVASMPTGYKLFVEDGILTERLKVAVNGSGNWADYVFADDYKLMPLEEVEAFVNQNKHLPNVPSADEMAETGIDVAKVDAKLMEKIEELTLYMIEMKKEIKSLKAENEAMKANLKK